MRCLAGLVICSTLCSIARAQPSATPPLTAEQQHVIEDGEVSEMQHIGGALTGVLFGFGVGQAIEGRWHETGWIVTVGETASAGAMVYGAIAGMTCTTHCELAGVAMVGGLLGAAGFHVWGAYDAIIGPLHHNRRLQALKFQLSAPHGGDRGGVAGMSLRF